MAGEDLSLDELWRRFLVRAVFGGSGFGSDVNVTNAQLHAFIDNLPTSTEISNDVGNPIPTTRKEDGVWDYQAGVSGVEVIVGRVVGIMAHSGASGGTVSINAGDAIPIPANVGLAFSPSGNITNPTITFTGTDSYMVEYVT